MVLTNVVPPAPFVVLVQADVDVQIARVVVSLDVEGLRHRLCRRVELELVPLAVASHHALAYVEAPLHAVVGADHQVLDCELHRVVALLDLRVIAPCLAGPCAGRVVLLALFPVPLATVIVVRTLEVPVYVLAIVVLLVVPGPLPLDAVVCQGEWRWWLVARPVVSEPVVCNVVFVAVFVEGQKMHVDANFAGVVVGLDFEGRALAVRGRCEGVLVMDLIASSHALAYVELVL